MRVWVQDTLRNPQDAFSLDHSGWASLPVRPEPRPGQVGGNNNTPGYIWAINVQGKVFAGFDHYHLSSLANGGVRATCWNDDAVDWLGNRNAVVHDFYALAPDPTFGLGDTERVRAYVTSIRDERKRAEIDAWVADSSRWPINTRQTVTHYREQPIPGVESRPWSEFIAPTTGHTIHGIWVSDALMLAHEAARTSRGWREWADDLPVQERDGTKVRSQRDLGRYLPTEHTRTYYMRDTTRANNFHNVGSSWGTTENALETTTAAAGTITRTASGASSQAAFLFTGPAGEPDSADWPDGTYRVQIDVNAIGANCSITANTVHICHQPAAGTSDLTTLTFTHAAITTTGLHLLTLATNPAAGNATDIVALRIEAAQSDMMNSQSIVLDVNTADSFIDGPWAGAGPDVTQPYYHRTGGVPGMNIGRPGSVFGRSW